MPKVRVAGYGRMSTIDQKLSPEVQTDKIKRWFQYQVDSGRWENGAEFVGMFVDEGVSSRIDMLKRPKGNELMTVLEPGDVIVCATLSRAFRSASDAENTLQCLGEANISLQFTDMPIDTSRPEGRLFLGMIAIMARFERDIISERTCDALAIKRKNGDPVTNAPCGWKNVRRGKKKEAALAVDIDRRIAAQASCKLIREGMSRRQLEKQMHHFSRKHRMNIPTSGRTLIRDAAASCLDFPLCSIRYAERLLGFSLNTIEFVKRDDHDKVKEKLSELAKEKGIKLWEGVTENDSDQCTPSRSSDEQ